MTKYISCEQAMRKLKSMFPNYDDGFFWSMMKTYSTATLFNLVLRLRFKCHHRSYCKIEYKEAKSSHFSYDNKGRKKTSGY